MDIGIPGTLVLAAVVAAAVIAPAIVLAIVFARRQPAGPDLAVLVEKVSRLEPVARGLGEVQVELRGLAERILRVEQTQGEVHRGLTTLGTGLTETGTVARSLVEATAAIHQELSRAAQDLTALRTRALARQQLEERTAESIRRLEAVIAGAQSKGAAGEHILDAVFAKLPPEWQVRDFRVGDRVVEFGLRLPNDLVLPIDSKWAATELLERFAACDAAAEQQRLRRQIEAAVLSRAREVRKYLQPGVTASFGVAAVPDAVYDLCWGVRADISRENVVLVSYSLFVPYLLLVFQTTLRHAQQIDLQKLEAYLQSVEASLAALRDELEGRFSRALTMLQNSRDAMGAHLGKVTGGLTGLRLGADGRGTARDGAGEGAADAAPALTGDAGPDGPGEAGGR